MEITTLRMGKIIIRVDYTDNYVACPATEDIACVVTARTFQKLQKELDFSLREHINWMREDGDPIPEEFEGPWEYEWDLTVRALLHYTEKYVTKATISKATGINQQQLTHYASGYRTPRPAMRKRIVDGIHSIAAILAAIS